MSGLNARAWQGLVLTVAAMALALFGSAGTIRYWQGWTYLAVFSTISTAITLYLMKHDPALLARRLKAGPTAEPTTRERIIMTLASLGFIGLLVVSGLDRRFGWSHVSPALVIAGDVLTLVGFGIIFRVYLENSYTSGTIEVQPGQTIVTTGPYAVVRHPMYAGGACYMLAMPLALGSWWGFPVFASFLPVLVWRLLDEEKLLSRDLPGYVEYLQRVHWRMIPGLF
ncbi:MAG TPA: isoprenylcysteine carboxylmethyltransferase family protein [Thermoanaerobaculia bacterium]|nr:isoprenylcysteine carboxylmethyltransferase family protein [Thermoanaerobaculia bacterium]